MDSSTFFGSFSSADDVISEFKIDPSALEGMQILFAEYNIEYYEGSAMVLMRQIVPNEGKLFEVYGSHCSCYGLEGQWEPEETTITSLRLREERDAWHGLYHRAELLAMIDALEQHPRIGD